MEGYDIIEDLKKAKAGSRRLDWLITEYIMEIPTHRVLKIGWDYDWYRNSVDEYSLWRAKDSEGRQMELWQPKAFTTSADVMFKIFREEFGDGWVWKTIGSHTGATGFLENMYTDWYKFEEGANEALVLATLYMQWKYDQYEN